MSRSKLFTVLQAILVMAILFSLTTSPQPAQAEPQADEYVFRRSWGGEAHHITAEDVAIGPNGSIYITNYAFDRVTVLSPDRSLYTTWGEPGSEPGEFDRPTGIAVDASGYVYVVDTGNCRVQKFTSSGEYIKEWGSCGTGPGQFSFSFPTGGGIAVDSERQFVYVAEASNTRIQKFTCDGIYVAQWGTGGNGEGEFAWPYDVAVDLDGNIYVADSWNNRVQKFTQDGAYLTQWAVEGYNEYDVPRGIGVDQQGKVYVTTHYEINKYDSNGNFEAKWGWVGWGWADMDSYHLKGIGVDQYGYIYIAKYDQVLKYSSDGVLNAEWNRWDHGLDFYSGSSGDITIDSTGNAFVTENHYVVRYSQYGSYQLQWMAGYGNFGIVTDLVGIVYLVATGSHQVETFTNSGTPLAEWGGYGSDPGEFFLPYDITVNNQNIFYIADGGNDRIQVFTGSGEYLSEWGSEGSGNGQFSGPDGIATDYLGNVYVVDRGNSRVQKFDGDGNYLTQWGSAGSGQGQFQSPQGIAVNALGEVFVADRLNHRIQVFSSEGEFITEWGGYGNETGEFNYPTGISVGNNGDIYVVDSENQRVQVFSKGYPDINPVSGLVQNGSFEALPALMEWTYGGGLPVSRSTHTRHGSYSLLLGEAVTQEEQGQGQAWAYTTFYIPPDWENPTLVFRYNIFTNETIDYSDFFVVVQDGVGLKHLAIVLREGYPSGEQAPPAGTDLGWRSAGFDLSPYKGQHIRIHFSNRNLHDVSLGIWTYIDDVRVLDADYPFPQTVFLPMTIRK